MSRQDVVFVLVVALLSVFSTSVVGRHSSWHRQVTDVGHWAVADAPLVNLEVYYETLCPDSRDFIDAQLYPTARQVGSIINVTMIPYGNAKEVQNGSAWVYTCQHGPKECATNIVQTCGLSLHAGNASRSRTSSRLSRDLLDWIYCMEKSDDPSVAGQPCAEKVGFDWDAIQKCAESSTGNQLEHLMGLKTEALNPPHNWVPWIVVNGVHNAAIQAEAVSNLIQLMCDTYTGTRPKACPP